MFVLVSRRVLYTTFVVKGHARCRVSREAFPIPTPSNFGAHETAGGNSTEPRKKVGTWLRDISSWPCLAFLPGPAWL